MGCVEKNEIVVVPRLAPIPVQRGCGRFKEPVASVVGNQTPSCRHDLGSLGGIGNLELVGILRE